MVVGWNEILAGAMLAFFEVVALYGYRHTNRQMGAGWILVFIKYPVAFYTMAVLGYWGFVIPYLTLLFYDVKRCRNWCSVWLNPEPF